MFEYPNLYGDGVWNTNYLDTNKVRDAENALIALKQALKRVHGLDSYGNCPEDQRQFVHGLTCGIEAYLIMLVKGKVVPIIPVTPIIPESPPNDNAAAG